MKTRWKQDENIRKQGKNIRKQGETIRKHGEHIVPFIQNHFVNKVDQVLLPKQFYMKQNFAFH